MSAIEPAAGADTPTPVWGITTADAADVEPVRPVDIAADDVAAEPREATDDRGHDAGDEHGADDAQARPASDHDGCRLGGDGRGRRGGLGKGYVGAGWRCSVRLEDAVERRQLLRHADPPGIIGRHEAGRPAPPYRRSG